MLGFGITTLNLSASEFWEMTPLEFNAASDCWINMNVSEEDRAKHGIVDIERGGRSIKLTDKGKVTPWGNEDLLSRARALMAEHPSS